MTFDSIIFDVDGTLWDSTDIAAASYNKVLEKEGLSVHVTGDMLKQLFGKPMDEIFATLLPGVPHEDLVRLADDSMEQENIDLETASDLGYPRLAETFQELSKKYRLFIVSNCQCGYIELAMKGTGIEPYITGHLCFGETGTSKGQTILRLMREHDLHAPIYVGDIQGDANACKEAGIPIIHAAYGFGTIEEPYARIQTPYDLVGLLCR